MLTLVIDTSTERGIMGIVQGANCLQGSEILFEKELPFGLRGSRSLMPVIDEAFNTLNLSPKDLANIAVGIGPGSYTGIRVGVIVAKAIAFACKIPLIGVTSFLAFMPQKKNSFALILDAKIGGVYIMKGLYSEPEICLLENLGSMVEDVEFLISPHEAALKTKIYSHYPQNRWIWQECIISALPMAIAAQEKFLSDDYSKEGHLELLYLRKTQAEINKNLL